MLTWWLGITAITWHVVTWCWLGVGDSDSGGMYGGKLKALWWLSGPSVAQLNFYALGKIKT